MDEDWKREFVRILSDLIAQRHAGEAEAITLAVEMRVDVVLIDEQEGRQLAAQVGLAVTSVLGILLRAKRDEQIAELQPEIRALRQKARFFISSALEARVLSSAGE